MNRYFNVFVLPMIQTFCQYVTDFVGLFIGGSSPHIVIVPALTLLFVVLVFAVIRLFFNIFKRR